MRIHISLNVRSVALSNAFYASLFGSEPTKIKDRYSNFRLDEPPIHLALQEGGNPSRGGVSHIGVELPDHETLGRWQQRLEDRGVTFTPENEAKCCYAKADKLWLSDPDGYRWEIWVRTGEIERMGETRPEVVEQACACA